MTTEKLDDLRAALAAKAELAQQIEQQSQTTRGLQERSTELETAEQNLKEEEAHDAVLRLSDGAESAQPNAKRRKQLLTIREESAPLPDAIALSSKREAELRKKRAEIEQRIAHHVFAWVSEVRARSAQQIKAGLDTLAPHIGLLAATDRVLRGITNEKPVFSANEFPDEFSGAFVAEKFLKGLTFFTRPESLADLNFEKAVAEAAAKLISQLTGANNA